MDTDLRSSTHGSGAASAAASALGAAGVVSPSSSYSRGGMGWSLAASTPTPRFSDTSCPTPLTPLPVRPPPLPYTCYSPSCPVKRRRALLEAASAGAGGAGGASGGCNGSPSPHSFHSPPPSRAAASGSPRPSYGANTATSPSSSPLPPQSPELHAASSSSPSFVRANNGSRGSRRMLPRIPSGGSTLSLPTTATHLTTAAQSATAATTTSSSSSTLSSAPTTYLPPTLISPLSTAAMQPSPPSPARSTTTSSNAQYQHDLHQYQHEHRFTSVIPWEREPRCMSCACRQANRMSYWQHPKLRKLMMRAKISCALRVKPPLTPYSSFVPRALHNYLIQLSARTTEEVPFGTVKTGAVLFADASGFTALTERLAQKGEKGAEELCTILNGFFTILVDIVHKFCGDIVKFAGDAVSIVWMIDGEPGAPRDMKEATLWATCCASEIHARLHNYVATEGEGEDEPVKLSLHIGVGCGELTCIHVGGVFTRWEFVVAGPPMRQIAVAEPLAEPGETVLSPEAWALVGSYARGTSVRDLVHCDDKVNCSQKSLHRSHEATPDQADYMRLDGLDGQLPPPPNLPPSKLRHRDIAVLRRYIPAAVQPKLKAGHDGHLAEMRDVSVLFVKCEGLRIEADADGHVAKAIDAGQQLMLVVQHTVYSCEGSINKFLVDDKGLLVLCVFGLPPLAHVDDGKRAVAAALALVERVAAIAEGVHCSVGVSTGKAFCGVIGSRERREYTVIGDMVNLAARLMGSAKQSEVLVDLNTRNVTADYIVYEEYEPQKMKGKAEKVRIFHPLGERQRQKSAKVDLSLQSRSSELRLLREMLQRSSGPLVLTGERGSGKSALVDALAEAGAEYKLVVVMGDNKPEEKTSKAKDTLVSALNTVRQMNRSVHAMQSPGGGSAGGGASTGPSASAPDSSPRMEGPTFAAWGGAFQALVAKGTAETGLAPGPYVLSLLSPADERHAALLNFAIDGLNLPMPESTSSHSREGSGVYHPGSEEMTRPRAMTMMEPGDVPISRLTTPQKIVRMKKLLADLLLEFARTHATLVILHLQTGTSMQATVDPESWSLALCVTQLLKGRPADLPKLILCVVSRPLINYCPVEFIEIVEIARHNRMLLQLKNLSREDSAHYLYQVLGASRLYNLPAILEEYVYDNAAGNPKHIEEIVAQLRDKKALEVVNGRVSVLVDSFDHIPIPDKTSGTTMGLIDRMMPRHQLVVKVASMCEYFSLNMLRELIPYPDEMQHLPEVLVDLVESGIFIEHRAPHVPLEVLLCEPDASICYSFQCRLLKKQCNQLLLHANRKELEHTRSKLALMGKMKSKKLLQSKVRLWLDWIQSPAGMEALQRKREALQPALVRKPATRAKGGVKGAASHC